MNKKDPGKLFDVDRKLLRRVHKNPSRKINDSEVSDVDAAARRQVHDRPRSKINIAKFFRGDLSIVAVVVIVVIGGIAIMTSLPTQIYRARQQNKKFNGVRQQYGKIYRARQRNESRSRARQRNESRSRARQRNESRSRVRQRYESRSRVRQRNESNNRARQQNKKINGVRRQYEILIAKGSTWKYLDDGSDQNTEWREVGFSDATWKSGPAVLGYGNKNENTVVKFIDTMPGDSRVFAKNATTYFRRTFDVGEPAALDSLQIYLRYDDSAAIYINGIEAIRTNNLSPHAGFDTYSQIDTPDERRFFSFDVQPAVLAAIVSGENTIAVEIHQGDETSSDIKFDLELRGRVGIESDAKSGKKTAPPKMSRRRVRTALSKDKQNDVTNQGAPNGVSDASAIKELMTPDQLALGGPVVNHVGMVFVPIPTGEFQRGSHLVQITKPFYLSAYEVTQEQYKKVMGNNPSDNKGNNKPVEMVSWNDAVDFCRELSEQEGVEFRLPTEAEWEYACRAGTTTAYSFGDDKSQLGKYAWHVNNSNLTTHPVGQKLPNAWGLYDMHGNVDEWCQDWYARFPNEKVFIDPTGPVMGRRRVLRGGAFNDHPKCVRSLHRHTCLPDPRGNFDGVRLVRTYNLSRNTNDVMIDRQERRPAILESSQQAVDAAPVVPTVPPSDASAIKELLTPDQLALGDPVVNHVGMVFVPIPAGEFQMGSPKSEPGHRGDERQHLVRIAKPFYLSAYEVTQEQYNKVMGNNPSDNNGNNKPVEMISWNDAIDFCRKLSEQECVEFRLPTEAEWEYACRAGTTTAYSLRDDTSQLGKYAWYNSNAGNTTHPVGEKLPNAWGLHDMHGNVWEWCQDAQGNTRVLRGGAFFNLPMFVRSAHRYTLHPDFQLNVNGFRLARTYDLSL